MLQNRDTFTNPTTRRAPAPRDLAVDAVILLLAETWPAALSVYEKRRRPLKLAQLSLLAASGNDFGGVKA